MARAEKQGAVAELAEQFRSSAGAVLTEYRGLSVAQLSELRGSLGEHATFAVVKNTLTKIAAQDAGVSPELTQLLSGPSAIAFVSGDVVEAARSLRDFSRANPLLVIKGGVLEGSPLTPDEVIRLADLEPREVLLAKLAGAFKASLAGAAATFGALPAQMARLLAALEEKGGAGGGSAAAAPEAPGSPADAAPAPSEVPVDVAPEAPEAAASEAPVSEAPAAVPAASDVPAASEAPADGGAPADAVPVDGAQAE